MVKNLTVESIDEVVKEAGLAAVMFHRGCCEPSREMVPEFARYSETRSDIKFFLLERQQGKPLFERFNIKGYPTVVFYRDGHLINQYDGWKDYETMAAFIDSVK